MKKAGLKIFKSGSNFLQSQFPIICGAMSWISTPELVASVSNAGGFGCLAGGNLPANELEKIITKTKSLTNKPFAISLLTISPQYHEQLYLVQWMKLPYVIFAGSFPKKNEIKMVKESGSKVICYASTKVIAKRMIKNGADALILEGSEAGGYVGRVSLNILLQQILFDNPDVPIFAAGGLVSGKLCAHLLLMGVSGVILGTRFALSEESCAHDDFKKCFIHANSRDAVVVPQYDSRLSVVPARTVHNKGLEDFRKLKNELIKKIDNHKINRTTAQKLTGIYWINSLKKAVIDGNIEEGALMAGQSVGLINNIKPVEQIINDLVYEIEEEIKNIKKILD